MRNHFRNAFNRRAALRIAAVSLLLAAITSPIAWFVAREGAEESTVLLAMEESRRLLRHFDVLASDLPDARRHASQAATTLAGGLFDIAEIYDQHGTKQAEASTPAGAEVERQLPKHGRPNYSSASYESVKLPDGRWVLRIFVPLQQASTAPIAGYFEGVRVVPEWQRQQLLAQAMQVALLAGLAALLCGLAIYPVVVRLSADNARKAREVLDSHISMMEALGRAIAKRDSDTGAHNYRVAWIAARIGEDMGLQGKAMQSLIAGSFLHDVGKIGIPDAILLKPGKLDEEEFAIMRTHVQQGEQIVQGISWLDGAHKVVASHHEKWNGSGYPRQLAGSHIPLAARIFAVADVFDALCSRRPYKEPMTFDAAMAILRRDSGSHFDPDVVAVFEGMADSVYNRLTGTTEDDVRCLLEGLIRRHFGL